MNHNRLLLFVVAQPRFELGSSAYETDELTTFSTAQFNFISLVASNTSKVRKGSEYTRPKAKKNPTFLRLDFISLIIKDLALLFYLAQIEKRLLLNGYINFRLVSLTQILHSPYGRCWVEITLQCTPINVGYNGIIHLLFDVL